MPVDQKTFEEGKVPALLSYWVWPLAYLMTGENRFAKYHVSEGLNYFVFGLLLYVPIFALASVGGVTLAMGLSLAVTGGFLYMSLTGSRNVLEKKEEPLPYLEKVPFLHLIVAKVQAPLEV